MQCNGAAHQRTHGCGQRSSLWVWVASTHCSTSCDLIPPPLRQRFFSGRCCPLLEDVLCPTQLRGKVLLSFLKCRLVCMKWALGTRLSIWAGEGPLLVVLGGGSENALHLHIFLCVHTSVRRSGVNSRAHSRLAAEQLSTRLSMRQRRN